MSTIDPGGNSRGANPGRFRSNQPGTHTLAVRELDRYPTPRIAVESLLTAEPDVLNTTRASGSSPPATATSLRYCAITAFRSLRATSRKVAAICTSPMPSSEPANPAVLGFRLG